MPVGREVLFPKPGKRFFDHRQIMMGIEIAFAEPGEMLAGADHACRFQPGQKFARIRDYLLGDRLKRRASSSPCARLQSARSSTGAKSRLKPSAAQILADELAMLAKELAFAGSENLGRRRRGAGHIAEAVDPRRPQDQPQVKSRLF